jgi:hypothetical protein
MAESIQVPCVPLPELPEIPSITLIGGASLSGFVDFSQGMPTDCSVTFSLMQQLAPVLAALAPLLKILKVLQALKATAESAFLNAGDLITALGDLGGLFLSLTPAGIAVTVAGILRMIIGFLKCFITQLESVVKVQADIALIEANVAADPALGSAVLTASLSCAQANAELSMQSAMASLGPVQPLLDMVTMLGEIAGLPLSLSLNVSAGGELAGTLTSLRETITQIEGVINSLPV